MARVLLSLTIEDSDADTSTVSVYVNAGDGDTVVSLASDYAHVLWDAIQPIIDGILVDVSITLKPDFSGWTNNIVDILSDVEERAKFTLRVCGGSRPVKLSLPTIKEEVFENAGMGAFVDVTNSDIQAFYFVLENGVVDNGIGMTDTHGTDICQVMFGEQFFGKG